jgi:hypothetical protein
MLTCIYHPIDPMRVVEKEEADKMKASGVWFDSPAKAQAYRDKVEADIKNDSVEIIKPKQKGNRK